MWYKIYLIGKHILKRNKEHEQQDSIPSKEDESSETNNSEVSPAVPLYNTEYMRKHGKELLIVIAFVILCLFVKGFVV